MDDENSPDRNGYGEGIGDLDQNQLLAIKEELESKTEEDCTEEILSFLECHDPNKYRKKIKGFHIAFNIREKVLRIGENELSKYKF